MSVGYVLRASKFVYASWICSISMQSMSVGYNKFLRRVLFFLKSEDLWLCVRPSSSYTDVTADAGGEVDRCPVCLRSGEGATVTPDQPIMDGDVAETNGDTNH